MDLEKRITKMEQRVDELAQKVKKLEGQIMRRVGMRSEGNRCAYCKHPITPGLELCGHCKAILEDNK